MIERRILIFLERKVQEGNLTQQLCGGYVCSAPNFPGVVGQPAVRTHNVQYHSWCQSSPADTAGPVHSILPAAARDALLLSKEHQKFATGVHIRYAAAAPVWVRGRNNVVPEEHQKSWCCLHVNKAVNTQFNTQLHHNHDAREHYF